MSDIPLKSQRISIMRNEKLPIIEEKIKLIPKFDYKTIDIHNNEGIIDNIYNHEHTIDSRRVGHIYSKRISIETIQLSK